MSDERDHVDRWLEETQLPGAVDLEVEGIVDRINGLGVVSAACSTRRSRTSG